MIEDIFKERRGVRMLFAQARRVLKEAGRL